MRTAPIPANEDLRLARLRSFGILDTLPQQAFDEITTLAASICGTPIALISLVDEDRQWFKSRVGLGATETHRDFAFCSHAIHQSDEVMVVSDASQDQRFHDNPLVSQDPNIRFYAGAPIVTDDGFAMGTVCVIDTHPRELNAAQLRSLQSLSKLVTSLLEHQRLVQAQAKRQSEESLYRNRMFEALTLSGLDLKSFVDTTYTYRFVNQTYLDYFCKDFDDIVGKTVPELLGPELFEAKVKPQLDRALAGEHVHYSMPTVFPAKGLRHVEASVLPARGENGEIIGVVVRVQDVHSRVERETQLQKTVELLEHKTLEQDRFIHIISHDLREPINAINNFTGLLAGDESIQWPGKTRRYLDFVRNGGLRMERLLNDLLGFVRLDHHAMEREPVSLNRLLDDVRADLSLSLERSSGELTVQDLPVVYGDPTMLRVTLQNLVSNALKFARAGVPPRVQVTHSVEDNVNVISVQDNGIGIAADKLGAVFDLFKRLHDQRQYEGTGLGLSICRRVAELHGGSVEVSSVPGEGSCFTLRLPLEPAAVKEAT